MLLDQPAVLSIATYDGEYRDVHDCVFASRPLEEGPFRDPTWLVVPLTGGLYLESDILFALGQAARSVGDHEYVIVDRDGTFPDEPPLLLSWSERALDMARSGTVLGHVDVDAFGKSGRWGLVASCDGFAVMGGDGQVVGRFFDAAGGIGRVRALFRDSLESGELSMSDGLRRYGGILDRLAAW